MQQLQDTIVSFIVLALIMTLNKFELVYLDLRTRIYPPKL